MLEPGERAPDFELMGLDGSRRRLSAALAAGPVLVVFFKSACRTSDLLFRYLPRLAEAYPQASVWAISQDDAEESRRFAERHGVWFPVLLDGDGLPISQRYDPEATPTFFLIGRDRIVEQVSVAFSKDELNEASRRLAAAVGRPEVLVAPTDDGNPPFRPG